MEENVALSADETHFIEEMGLHFEGLGAPRIGGRLLGLLLLAPRPLLLDELAELLLVSRASVSTNTRLLMHIGIVEPRSVPGDRRRYYVIADDAWAHRLHVVAHEARELQRLVGTARAAIAPSNGAAAKRLAVADAFAVYLQGAAATMLDGWRAASARGGES